MASTDSAPKSKIASVGEQAILCRAAQSGDKKAEAQLVTMHMPIMFREARRYGAEGEQKVDLRTDGRPRQQRAAHTLLKASLRIRTLAKETHIRKGKRGASR